MTTLDQYLAAANAAAGAANTRAPTNLIVTTEGIEATWTGGKQHVVVRIFEVEGRAHTTLHGETAGQGTVLLRWAALWADEVVRVQLPSLPKATPEAAAGSERSAA